MELNQREIVTMLASLRMFQKEAKKLDMAEAYPDHFLQGEVRPLTSDEIEQLCEKIAGVSDD
ncbi:MAG: hypothetical protein PUP93_11360 [Rhizonema sp. NSF051]|nr:hypothetical protein [Rhizonema sp. NSF051]